jgi:hypothetical protein
MASQSKGPYYTPHRGGPPINSDITGARTAKEKPHALTTLLEERFTEVMMSEHKGTLEGT